MNLKNKKILVTGGSGSWGNELVKQLLNKDAKEITSFARNEYRQVKLKRKYNDKRLKIVMGDVRDFGELKYACKDIDIVFHLAAVKHVPVCENQPYEAIKTNINGTRNIVRASIENNVEKVIDVSTDKAVAPINTYGMSKAIGEKLIINGANINSSTRFTCIRAGNVLGTNGSVVPLFKNQIKLYNKVTITDDKMTRYFLTIPQAIKLLFTASENNINGGLFVMKMLACKISDLADVLIEKYGNNNTKKEIIGIRPGEKVHELLISKNETPNTYIWNNDYYFINNTNNNLKVVDKPKVNFKEYSSNTKLMNKQEIKKLLRLGGFYE